MIPPAGWRDSSKSLKNPKHEARNPKQNQMFNSNFEIMSTKLPTIKQLLDSGAHFGHLRARSHPRARNFAFEVRDQVVLIDLDKTIEHLKLAADYCRMIAKEGKTILFVGTKRQAKQIVQETANQAGMPYVNNRWLAGTLTNFNEVINNVRKLERLEKRLQESQPGTATKRERVKLAAAVEKLHRLLDGIAGLTRLPDALLVVDAGTERIAVGEASRIGIPIVAISDTNVDPTLIDYPIPANDDSAKAIELILDVLTQAIVEGKSKIKNEQ